MPLRLIIEDEEGSTTIVPLASDAVTIGRQPGNTIQLTERNVSRQHARLLPEGELWAIEDLGSYNGIKVNGEGVKGRVALKEGDVVQIGDYHLAITEDPDKRSLNYDARLEEAANDEPLLASSSILPRLSKEDLRTVRGGDDEEDEDRDEDAVITVPGPRKASSSSSADIDGPIRPESGAGAPELPPEPEPEGLGIRGMGVFVGAGVVLGLVFAAVFAWRTGDAPPSANTDEPSEVVALPSRPSTPVPELDVDPPPVVDVKAGGGESGTGVGGVAETDTDESSVDSSAEVSNVAVETVARPLKRDRARDPASGRVRPGAGASSPGTSSQAQDRRSSASKPPASTKVEPTTAPSGPATPSGPAEPEPAAAEPDTDADALLGQARMEQFKNPAGAYELAKSSYATKRSEGALVVMASTACRLGDAGKAKRAIARLQGDAKTKMQSACEKQGVTF